MNIRNHTAHQYREIRKILQSGRSFSPQENPKEELWAKVLRVFYYLSIIGCILLMLRGCEQPGWSYTDQQAIQTIVGESANQGFKGMVCVGEVIRHNSTLKPFYGFKAMNHRYESPNVWNMAKQAWLRSKYTHYTQGADHFENINAFGEPYWVKKCVLTFEYRDHKFYREVK